MEDLPWWLGSKEFACNAGDMGLIPGSGRSPGGGHGHSLQYYCLENPMDRGSWWATVHRVTRHGVIIQSIGSQVINTTEAT